MKCVQARVETLTFNTVTKLAKKFMYFCEETCQRLSNVKLKRDAGTAISYEKAGTRAPERKRYDPRHNCLENEGL